MPTKTERESLNGGAPPEGFGDVLFALLLVVASPFLLVAWLLRKVLP